MLLFLLLEIQARPWIYEDVPLLLTFVSLISETPYLPIIVAFGDQMNFNQFFSQP